MSASIGNSKAADSRLALPAWVIWAIFLVVVCVVVGRRPNERTVTPNYRHASLGWWEGKDIYTEQVGGYLYLPQAAILYTPFTLPPLAVGEVCWRLFGGLLLVMAVYRLAKAAGGDDWPAFFLIITLLSIAASAGSLRNGQMNIPLGALMIHAVMDLIQKRWSRSAALLTVALAFKPLALVLILLVAALYPRSMAWRLAVGILVMLLLPFLLQPQLTHFSPDFVIRQYDRCARTMLVAGNAGEAFYPADVSGMLRDWRMEPSAPAMLLIRAIAAVVTLGLGWLALRRWHTRWGAILLLGLAVTYLMLFNPRTENNSYTMLAPIVAAFAAAMIFLERSWLEGGILVLIALGLGFANEITHGETHWFRPLLACVFFVYLAVLAVAGNAPATREGMQEISGENDTGLKPDAKRSQE